MTTRHIAGATWGGTEGLGKEPVKLVETLVDLRHLLPVLSRRTAHQNISRWFERSEVLDVIDSTKRVTSSFLSGLNMRMSMTRYIILSSAEPLRSYCSVKGDDGIHEFITIYFCSKYCCQRQFFANDNQCRKNGENCGLNEAKGNKIRITFPSFSL